MSAAAVPPKSPSAGPKSPASSPPRSAAPRSGSGVKSLPQLSESKAVVFKGASRSKAVFKSLDQDQDKFLSRAEFTEGLAELITVPELVLTPAQIDALWAETDLNKDEKVSWAEFNYRFCGGPHPNSMVKKVEKKPSLMLQTPRRKKDAPTGKAASAVAELQQVLEAVYDGVKPRYPGVDLSKARTLNAAGLKKLLQQTLAEEKNEAKDQKRELDDWAAACTASGSINDQKAYDRLFAQLDSGKTGKVDLQPLFEQLKLRPSRQEGGGSAARARKSKTANKSTGPQAYVLSSVKSDNVRDWVSELILKALPDNVSNSVKCHPPLRHWGDDDRRRKGLNTEGYKTSIFLSERTKIKAIIKMPDPHWEGAQAAAASAAAAAGSSDAASPAAAAAATLSPTPAPPKPVSAASSRSARSASVGSRSRSASSAAPPAAPRPPDVIYLFASYRTEYTGMARQEWLCHARITMDDEESVQKVEVSTKRHWCDGEVDQHVEETFPEWSTFVGQEDEFEETSIPPIA